MLTYSSLIAFNISHLPRADLPTVAHYIAGSSQKYDIEVLCYVVARPQVGDILHVTKVVCICLTNAELPVVCRARVVSGLSPLNC